MGFGNFASLVVSENYCLLQVAQLFHRDLYPKCSPLPDLSTNSSQQHSSTMAEYCWPPSVLSKEMALHEEAQFKICTTCMLAQASVNTPKTAMSCDIKFNGQEIKSCWYCYCHGNKTNCNMVSNTALFNLAHFYCMSSVLMTPGTSRTHPQIQPRQAAP